MLYDVEITKENPTSIHFRILSEGTEVLAGGVDRAEFEEARKRTRKGKAEVIFGIAKQRMPEVFSSGGVKLLPVETPVGAEAVVRESGTEGTVEVPVEFTVAPHEHHYADYSDVAALRTEVLSLVGVADPRVDTVEAALKTHTHDAAEYPHGHPLVDARMHTLETALEFQVSHQHPHVHPQESHTHPEFKQLSDALVALAEELRTTRLTFLGHDHKHRHEDLESTVGDVVLEVRNHEHQHEHPAVEHTHPAVDHSHPPHDHYDPRVETLEATVAALKARPAQHVDLRILSRENRGGHDIIIAEEIQ